MGRELVAGEVYDVEHARKGRFQARLLSCNDEWLEVQIVSGQVRTISMGLVYEPGDQITLRKSMVTLTALNYHPLMGAWS